MGMPNRLHGKMVSLPPGKKATCPECLRQFDKYRMITVENKVIRLCPYCKEEIPPKNIPQSK